MKKISKSNIDADDAQADLQDDLRPEYDFDFSKARPNRFAVEQVPKRMDIFVPIGSTVLKATCLERDPKLLAAIMQASYILVPLTVVGKTHYPVSGVLQIQPVEKKIRYLSANRLCREILERFFLSITDANKLLVGDENMGSKLDYDAVMALVREWVVATGGFDTLPGVDEATAERLDAEIGQSLNQQLKSLL
jgi:hypothetical protein